MDWRAGLYLLVGANLGVFGLGALIDVGPSKLLATLPPLVLVLLGLAALLVAADVRAWRRLRRLAKARPDEPWLWDRTWRRELRAENLRRVLEQLIPRLFLHGFLCLILIGGPLRFVLSDMPWVFLSVTGVFLVFNGLISWSVNEQRMQPLRSWLHFGRPRLRVPQVPMKLGARYPLHLIIPPAARTVFSRVTGLQVELRRLRHISESRGSGKESRTVTVSTTEYTRAQSLGAGGLGDGREPVIELELPDAGAGNTSVLNGSARCFWELHITGDAPGTKLELCYLLPAYHLVGENPSAWKDAA
jgi:hypothetical protein